VPPRSNPTGVRAVTDDETPTRYLGLTIRVYSLNSATGERTYLPVSVPNSRNASFNGPCTCPECRTTQAGAVESAEPEASALEQAGVAAASMTLEGTAAG